MQSPLKVLSLKILALHVQYIKTVWNNLRFHVHTVPEQEAVGKKGKTFALIWNKFFLLLLTKVVAGLCDFRIECITMFVLSKRFGKKDSSLYNKDSSLPAGYKNLAVLWMFFMFCFFSHQPQLCGCKVCFVPVSAFWVSSFVLHICHVPSLALACGVLWA